MHYPCYDNPFLFKCTVNEWKGLGYGFQTMNFGNYNDKIIELL